jgi:hypothetical protein
MLFSGLALMLMAPLVVQAQDKGQYGPFTALKLDAQIVEDVRVEGDNVYVKVQPGSRNASFAVKVADGNMADYRKWHDGTSERAVKVYQGPQTQYQGYTYRVSTTAKYIEYYLDGKLILQLERVK